MKAVALIGFMAAGKSAVGRELAQRLQKNFVDLDEAIAQSALMTIGEIFERYGENYFRQEEQRALEHFAVQKDIVLATGGGAVLNEKNRAILNERFFVVSLSATPDMIWQRVQKDGATRPLLAGYDDPLARIKTLLKERAPFYEKADLFIDTSQKTVAEIVEMIVNVWRNDDAYYC